MRVMMMCTAVYTDHTPAMSYLSNAFRALYIDRVNSTSPFPSSFRNLRNIPEFWSVRIIIIRHLAQTPSVRFAMDLLWTCRTTVLFFSPTPQTIP